MSQEIWGWRSFANFCKAQLAGGGLPRSQDQKKQQLLCAKSLWSMVRMHHCRQGFRDARKLFEPIWGNLKLFVEPCWATVHIFWYLVISSLLASSLQGLDKRVSRMHVVEGTMWYDMQWVSTLQSDNVAQSGQEVWKLIDPMKRQMSCVDGLSWRLDSSRIHWVLYLQICSCFAIHPRSESHVEVNTIHYNVVVSACRKESFWPLSLDLVTGVTGMRSLTLEPSIVSFNSVADGSWLLSLQLLRQSGQRMLRATAVSYNSACNAISEVQTDKFGGTKTASGSKQWPWALEVFSQMSQKSISSDQVGLTAAMKAVSLNSSPSDPSSWQIVLTAIEADGHCDVVSFTTAITICGAAKQWQVALSLLQHMSGIANLVPNRISFGAAISACEKASQWTWALQLLDVIQNVESFQPNEIILSAVISACEKSSRWEIALSLLLSLGRLDLEMTSESYNPVIAASATSNWQLACELFSQIPAMRLSPDSFSYAAMMKAFAHGSKWQAALLFLQRESSSDLKNGNDGKSKSSNAVICESQEFSREMFWNSAMNACLRGTQWQIALDIFNTMFESETFTETSFNAAISACAQGSNWQVAMNLLHLLYTRGVVPSVVSYSAAITSCGSEWGRALELLEEMRRNEVLPNVVTYNSVINVCEKGLQWQLALQTFSEVKEEISVDLILYSSVISACGTASAWLIALHLFHESQVDKTTDAEATEVATVAAITACERGCQWQFALQLLHTMLEMKLDDSMSSLACGHVRQSCHYFWTISISYIWMINVHTALNMSM